MRRRLEVDAEVHYRHDPDLIGIRRIDKIRRLGVA